MECECLDQFFFLTISVSESKMRLVSWMGVALNRTVGYSYTF